MQRFWHSLTCHTVLVDENGKLIVFGRNTDGQCGQSKEKEFIDRPIELHFDLKVEMVVTGYASTYVLADGKVFSCGSNKNGELGLGHYDNTHILSQMDIEERIMEIFANGSKNGGHFLCISENRKVYGCGRNHCMQLGGYTGSMNLNKIQEITEYEELNVAHFVLGGIHTFVITIDGKIYGCGSNNDGQILLDTFESINGLTRLKEMEKLMPIKQIVTSWASTTVLTEDHRVYMFGTNHNGVLCPDVLEDELQYEPILLNFDSIVKNSKVVGIACGHSANFFIFDNGDIVFIGSNILYEGGLKNNEAISDYKKTTTIPNIRDFVCLNCSSLVSSYDSKYLTVWGRSSSGQLGCGTDPFVISPIQLQCELFDSRKIACWGSQNSDLSLKLRWSPAKNRFFPQKNQDMVLLWMQIAHVLYKTTSLACMRLPKPIRIIICFYLNFFSPKRKVNAI